MFPWDPEARPGAPFSPQFVPSIQRQTQGRFDLGTHGGPQVLYLAESPGHAAAELLRPFTGQRIGPPELRGAGHALALVEVTLPSAPAPALADLTDPGVLVRYGIQPDALASRERQRTQTIARALHAAGLPGFRWWSALHGDWHSVLLFLDRVPVATLGYGAPDPLALTHPAVTAAARALNIQL